jgi:N-acetylmuramoyl-L-alanine amidase
MRDIDYIVLHCTATLPNASVDAIKKYWREVLGWKDPGYHYIIDAQGRRHILSSITQPTNGVRGYNARSIHIAYIGGISPTGEPKDTRNRAQKNETEKLIRELLEILPCRPDILGHRDFPGVRKSCPSFSVQEWLTEIEI